MRNREVEKDSPIFVSAIAKTSKSASDKKDFSPSILSRIEFSLILPSSTFFLNSFLMGFNPLQNRSDLENVK